MTDDQVGHWRRYVDRRLCSLVDSIPRSLNIRPRSILDSSLYFYLKFRFHCSVAIAISCSKFTDVIIISEFS